MERQTSSGNEILLFIAELLTILVGSECVQLEFAAAALSLFAAPFRIGASASSGTCQFLSGTAPHRGLQCRYNFDRTFHRAAVVVRYRACMPPVGRLTGIYTCPRRAACDHRPK
jgi:hypothetical protein